MHRIKKKIKLYVVLQCVAILNTHLWGLIVLYKGIVPLSWFYGPQTMSTVVNWKEDNANLVGKACVG